MACTAKLQKNGWNIFFSVKDVRLLKIGPASEAAATCNGIIWCSLEIRLVKYNHC
jgi:hypothetical protein